MTGGPRPGRARRWPAHDGAAQPPGPPARGGTAERPGPPTPEGAAERPEPPAPGEVVPVAEPLPDAEPLPPDVETQVESEFEDLDVDAPRVGIVMGSKSDMPTMEQAGKELEERDIHYEMRVMSAHRDPDVVAEYARNARMRGLRVIIAGAGLAAALPGVVAAHTELPVIGVPLSTRTSVAGGLDALLAIAQMPPGVPVACVAVDGARNAAVLAAKILAA